MKTAFLTVPALAIVLAGCAANNTGTTTTATEAREAREHRVGSYLPRKKGETAGNAGNVDKQQLENMQRVGAGTIDSSR